MLHLQPSQAPLPAVAYHPALCYSQSSNSTTFKDFWLCSTLRIDALSFLTLPQYLKSVKQLELGCAHTYLLVGLALILEHLKMAEDPTVCFLCCDAPPSIHSNPPCEHRWCTSCLGEYIDLAIKSETYYPIKMCPEEESLDISVIAENCDELQGAAENLLAKMKEYNTPPAERRYTNCCQAFIPKKNPRVYYTQCEGCWEVVCAKCGDEYHGKTACKSTEESEAQLVIEETTHRCPNPKCNVPIEKNRGCNHIL